MKQDIVRGNTLLLSLVAGGVAIPLVGVGYFSLASILGILSIIGMVYAFRWHHKATGEPLHEIFKAVDGILCLLAADALVTGAILILGPGVAGDTSASQRGTLLCAFTVLTVVYVKESRHYRANPWMKVPAYTRTRLHHIQPLTIVLWLCSVAALASLLMYIVQLVRSHFSSL